MHRDPGKKCNLSSSVRFTKGQDYSRVCVMNANFLDHTWKVCSRGLRTYTRHLKQKIILSESSSFKEIEFSPLAFPPIHEKYNSNTCCVCRKLEPT